MKADRDPTVPYFGSFAQTSPLDPTHPRSKFARAEASSARSDRFDAAASAPILAGVIMPPELPTMCPLCYLVDVYCAGSQDCAYTVRYSVNKYRTLAV